jgi:hypothetical protein
VRCETAWQWYLNDFLPRLKPDASQIVMMTRWHEDDLGGRLLAREPRQWRVVELPMEALPGDPLGRQPGRAALAGTVSDEMAEGRQARHTRLECALPTNTSERGG